ncbi:hypothetical protein QLT00_gp70 [Gordonia phage Commandaria]|uniref:DUF7352 domain-containing protein n=1 Tax=Gordonia phage Commandaria TaxID=3038364 RepID=A0AAF0GLP3_9CAUD|nr:hypothetical protein QLT00_gp70 [Gordonia phage Commandaria]WGH20853.1 hypothetical protein [Gordonia phage Commandaria]
MSEQTIWKYTVPVDDHQTIKVDNAVVVDVLHAEARNYDDHGNEGHFIDIWVVVKPGKGSVYFLPIEIRGTGHPLRPERLAGTPKEAHIATCIDGIFVWHVFRGTTVSL